MKKFLLFLILVMPYLLEGQTDFDEKEKLLVGYLQNLRETQSDSARVEISNQLRKELIDLLQTPESFKQDFSGLNKYMSNLISPDKKMRIYNWNISFSDYTNKYFAFVQTYNKKTKESKWFELSDFKNKENKLTNKYLKPNQWIGALYYKIIPVKKGKKTLYTVLGWSGLDKNIQQKTIEVINIAGGKLKLGAPIFKSDKGTQKRVIIKYSSEVKVSLKWQEKQKRIVFDHVVPRDPALVGAYAFYGPDLSFEAYNLYKDKWVIEHNVDVRMGKTNKIYNDPRPRKDRKKK